MCYLVVLAYLGNFIYPEVPYPSCEACNRAGQNFVSRYYAQPGQHNLTVTWTCNRS